jgi:hypothetical protein
LFDSKHFQKGFCSPFLLGGLVLVLLARPRHPATSQLILSPLT